MDAQNKSFFTSPELNQVVDLVIEREKLLKSLKLSDNILFPTKESKNMEKAQSLQCASLTAKLETLVVKREN